MCLCGIGSSLAHVCAQGIQCQARGVIGAAQVREPDPAHGIASPGAQEGLRRLVVGEMTSRTENALLQRIRIGAAQQFFAVRDTSCRGDEGAGRD